MIISNRLKNEVMGEIQRNYIKKHLGRVIIEGVIVLLCFISLAMFLSLLGVFIYNK